MITIRVTKTDGDQIITRINATLREAKEYYTAHLGLVTVEEIKEEKEIVKMKNSVKYPQEIVTIIDKNGTPQEITLNNIHNDINGNPRRVVHFLSLDLKDYESTKETRAAGLYKYNAKWYGGGFWFYNSKGSWEQTAQTIYNKLHNID